MRVSTRPAKRFILTADSTSLELRFDHFRSDADLAQQRELFRDCFPENAGSSVESSAHYLWKFHSFPNSTPSYEYGVWNKANNQMVGYYAAIPYRYSVAGRMLTCGMVCDVMTHSAARGQGIFTKLGTYSTKALQAAGVDFTSGYPIRPEVIPGHLKVGWKIAFGLPMYLKVLRANTPLKKTPIAFAAPLVNVGLKALNLITHARREAGYTTEILSFEDFMQRHGDAYRTFFDRWRADKPIHLLKDEAFLRWRLGAPGTEYSVIVASANEEIEALAFVRPTILKGISTLAVLDLMTLGNRSATATAFNALERAASESKCDTIAVMASPSSARKIRLFRYGFLRTPFVFKLIIKQLSGAASEEFLRDESKWSLGWIDSDDL
jgi:hypothetical protein